MDGNFVPNMTFGPDTIKWSRQYTTLPFETQLMVSEKHLDAMLPSYIEVSKVRRSLQHAAANIFCT